MQFEHNTNRTKKAEYRTYTELTSMIKTYKHTVAKLDKLIQSTMNNKEFLVNAGIIFWEVTNC